MSTTQTLTITTPDGTVSRVVMPTHISFEQNMGEISGFTAEFQSDWDDFLDETDGTNPVQMNATVEWIREGQVYAFFIISRELIEAENGEQVIKITCLDPLAKLTTTVAASNRQTIWTRTTPSSHTASNYIATSPGYIRLYQVEPIGDALYPFFPICADEVWLPRTDEYANYTTLGRPLGNGTHPVSVVDTGTHHFYSVDNIAAQLLDGIRFEVSGSTGNDGWYTCNGDANWTGFLTEIIVSETIPDATADGYIYPREIIATTSQAGMNPAGFIIINTEWIQYDGYGYTDYSDSYIFRNCYRGMLGSTAATHLADATIWQALSQKIHPSAEVLLAGSSTANGWEVISGSYYAVQPEEGRFDFTLDIENLKTGADKYVNFAAGYGVFDETDSHNTIRLASEGWVEPFAWGILDTVLSQERKAGGPNFDSWERDFGIYKIATVYTGTNTIQVYARQGEVLSVGDSITITGSVGAANDGAYTVVSATDVDLGASGYRTNIVVEEALTSGLGEGVVLAADNLFNIRLTRVRVTEPKTCWEFIRGLLDEVGLMKGTDEDFIGLFYNHINQNITIKPLSQAATPDYRYYDMTLIERDYNLDEIYSAVLVSYDYGQNLNLVSEDRMWHPKIGDLEGDSNGDVTHIAYLDEDTGDFAADWTLDGAAVTTNEHTKYLVDGRADTGWGLVFSNDPTGGNVIGLVCWFNDALDTMDVEEIEVTLDARMTSYAPGYGVKVNGFTGITLGDPPTLSGTKEISSALVLRFEEGNTATQSKITISAKDIGDPLKGIYIWWDRLSRKGSDEYALVKEVKVIGKKKATVLVQLTDSSYPDTDGGALHLSQFMYAPESYQKLVDNGYFAWIPERHRVKAINIGPGTFNTAVSLGRLVLLQSLVLEQQRNYSMTGKFKHIPPLGSTVLMQDGFQGVVLGVAYASDGGPETLTIRVLDFESGLVS